MITSRYYKINNSTPQTDTKWLDGISGIISTAITEIKNNTVQNKKIKFVVAAVTSANTTFVSDQLDLDITYLEATNQLRIGDTDYPYHKDTNEIEKDGVLYTVDLALDTFLSIAVTETLLLATAVLIGSPIAAGGLIGLGVAGISAILYSKFIDPITSDVLLSLGADGRDMVQFFDANGDETAGLIFPTGIPSSEFDAIRAFISHPESVNLDLTSGHIQLDTDLYIDDRFHIKDGSTFQDIANKLGISLSKFLSLSSGDYSNDEFYVADSNGKYYSFYEYLLAGETSQKLAVELTLDGVNQVINVDSVSFGSEDIWGTSALVGSKSLVFSSNGGGAVTIDGDDIFIGGNDSDTINVGFDISADFNVGATILAGGGDDTINGDGGNDNIDGGADNDTIDGGDGDDAIKGGLGNDTILVSEGNDIIDGGLGIDTMDFTPLDAFLNNDVDVNLNTGQATIKYLLQSDDIQQITNIENITTGGGDDSITGDAQDNVLDGGRGVDILDGGEGSDTYIFSGNFGHDTIVDTGTGNNSQSGGLNDIIAINGQSIGGEARYISDGVYELQIGLEKYQIKTSNGAAGGTLKIISESASNTITAENFTNGDFNISLQEKPTDVNPSSNLDDLLNSLSQAEATDPNQRIDPLVLDLNQNGFFRQKNANSVFRKNETFAESKISGASSLRLSEANEKRNEARFSKNSVLKNLKSNSNLKSFNKTLIQNFANDNSAIQHQKTARI